MRHLAVASFRDAALEAQTLSAANAAAEVPKSKQATVVPNIENINLRLRSDMARVTIKSGRQRAQANNLLTSLFQTKMRY